MVFVDQEADVLVSDDPAHLDLPEGDKGAEQGNARVLGRQGSLGFGASPELTIEVLDRLSNPSPQQALDVVRNAMTQPSTVVAFCIA